MMNLIGSLVGKPARLSTESNRTHRASQLVEAYTTTNLYHTLDPRPSHIWGAGSGPRARRRPASGSHAII
jgi:hypothetical protein